jgi:hypothetical protein
VLLKVKIVEKLYLLAVVQEEEKAKGLLAELKA